MNIPVSLDAKKLTWGVLAN